MLAICKFFVLNKGLTWPAGFEEDPAAHAAFLQECFGKHNIEKVYEHWRHWVATNTQATKFRVTGKKKATALRVVEAAALTPASTHQAFERLRMKLC